MANENNNKFIKLVSTGIIKLHLTLTLTDQEAEFFNIIPSRIDKISDCASFLSQDGNKFFLTSTPIKKNNKKLNIFDNIRLSSNNPTINTLLFINRAFKKKIFIEYVTMNDIKFLQQNHFMKDVIKYVTEQNFLFLVENKFIANLDSCIKFEIKINNKTVKVFENICDNNHINNSFHDDINFKSKTNINNDNLNNFNSNLINFNSTNIENNNEKIINLIQTHEMGNNDEKTNNRDEIKELSNANIDFSIKNKEDSLKKNNQSKPTSIKFADGNDIINNDNPTSRILLENDILHNDKTFSNQQISKEERSINYNRGGDNTNILNNSHKNLNENKEADADSVNNIENKLNYNLNLNQSGLSKKNLSQEIVAGSEKDINVLNPNSISEKQEADFTADKLLNSIEKKLNDSNIPINLDENNKLKEQNEISNNQEINNDNHHSEDYIKNESNKFNIIDDNNQQNLNLNDLSKQNPDLNENIYSGLPLQQKSSFGQNLNDLSNSPNLSPNTNFTNSLIKSPPTVFERFHYDFSGCNYFFIDLSEMILLKKFNFCLKDLLDLLKKVTFDFREISIITNFPNIIKNISLLDLESLNQISEVVSLTDIYVFDKNEAIAIFHLLAQLNSENESIGNEKNLEFLFIREIKRKKRPFPKIGLFMEGMKSCTIIQQQQNKNFVVFNSRYDFNLIAPNVSSVVFEDYHKIFTNNYEYLKAVYLGGFLSRLFYKKSFNTCFTAGNESLKRIIDLLRFNMEPPLDFNYYLIRIKKKDKGISEEEKINKKKEQNFVLDATNIVNSQMHDYNPLYDNNLGSFFSSKLTKSHLQKLGFINRNGVIIDDPDNKKITMFEKKNFEKIFEQEKNHLEKIKDHKEKMRLQIKNLLNINTQMIRTGSLKDLNKLAKIYTFNPIANKKLPNIEFKKTMMKMTKFDNNFYLKEIGKGNKPKSLFNFNPSKKNLESNLNYQMNNNNDILIHREKTREVTQEKNTLGNSCSRVTSKYNPSKSKERDSANYFNSSRIKSSSTNKNIISNISRVNSNGTNRGYDHSNRNLKLEINELNEEKQEDVNENDNNSIKEENFNKEDDIIEGVKEESNNKIENGNDSQQHELEILEEENNYEENKENSALEKEKSVNISKFKFIFKFR